MSRRRAQVRGAQTGIQGPLGREGHAASEEAGRIFLVLPLCRPVCMFVLEVIIDSAVDCKLYKHI